MKKILITGGSKGIGREIATSLAQKNYEVLITGRDINTVKTVADNSPKLSYFKADVNENQDRIALYAWIKEHWNGQLDGLVNNAGSFAITPLKQINEEVFLNILKTNVIAPSMLTSLLLPFLRQQEGTIVNISSVVGHKPLRGSSAYGASKAALSHLTKIWALELSPKIKVNAISPGPTDTTILANSGINPEEIKLMRNKEKELTPLGRIASVKDISNAVEYLLSSNAGHITGQTISIDGGFTI